MKNIFYITLVLLFVSLLSACGKETKESNFVDDKLNQPEAITPTTVLIDLSHSVGESKHSLNLTTSAVTQKTSALIETASIEWPGDINNVTGNLLFTLNANSDEEILEVSISLAGSNVSYSICEENCGTEFSASVIGLNPILAGKDEGTLELQVWVATESSGNSLAGRSFVQWQPHSIDSISVERLDNQMTVTWQKNEALERYNIYTASDINLTPQNATSLPNGQQLLSKINTSVNINNILDEETYFVLVTGVDGSGESGLSTMLRVDPLGVITPINPPQAEDDIYSIDEDSVLVGNVLNNDSASSLLTVDTNLLSETSNGSISINELGDFEYSPAVNFFGSDVFSYKVIDENGLTDSAIVTINIENVNDAPVALDNEYRLDQNNNISVEAAGVLSNDFDVDDNSLTAIVVEEPTFGTLQLDSTGGFNYQAGSNFNGQDQFTYKVVDTGGLESTAVVTLLALAANAAPNAVNDNYSVNEDGILDIVSVEDGLLGNDSDPEGSTLSISSQLISEPSHGQLIVSVDGTFRYIPIANFYGSDNFIYEVSDQQGMTSSASVTITVIPVPDAPTAIDDEYTVKSEQVFTATVQNGLGSNDINLDGGPLTFSLHNGSSPINGEINLSDDGSFNYTPAGTFIGADSFSYQVQNSSGLTSTATVSISVIAAFGIEPQLIELMEDTPLTSNVFSDIGELDIPNDVTLSIDTSSVSSAQLGVFNIDSVGNYSYVPNLNVNGIDTVTFIVLGSNGLKQTITVEFKINSVNDAPVVAETINLNIVEDNAAVNFDLLDHVSEIEGDTLSFVTQANGVSSGGVFSITESGVVNYSPNLNFYGLDSIQFEVEDQYGAKSSGTLTISVSPVNDAPVAPSYVINATEDLSLTNIGNLLGLASDVDGDDLTINTTPIVNVSNGVLGLNDDGTFDYTPALNFFGDDTFEYEISDGNGSTDRGVITLAVAAVNDAPILSAQSFSGILENVSSGHVVGTVIASDIEDDSITFEISGGDSALFNIDSNTGQLTVNGNSVLNFEAFQSHIIEVKATDNGSPNAFSTANISIGIENVIEPKVPVEASNFGRTLTGYIDLYGSKQSATLTDITEVSGNVYASGHIDNVDSDVYLISYDVDGNINSSFGDNGELTLNLGGEEQAKAIAEGNGNLYVLIDKSLNGSRELCVMLFDLNGTLDDDSGDNGSGIRCTTEESELYGSDITFVDNKVYAVGYRDDGTQLDSLVMKLDDDDLDFEENSPVFKDVSTSSRDDKANAIRSFHNNKLMVVGATRGPSGDLDGYVRYLNSDIENEGAFNGGTDLILDVPGSLGDDELLTLGGIAGSNFTAYIGGSTEQIAGSKDALVVGIDKTGAIDTSVDNDGFIIFNTGNDNGSSSSEINTIVQAFNSADLMAVGTVYENEGDSIFVFKMDSADGDIESSFGNGGILNVIKDDNINASSIVVDEYLRSWVVGSSESGALKPLMLAIEPEGSFFNCFPDDESGCGQDGELVKDISGREKDDSAISLLKYTSGSQATKYLSLSQVNLASGNILVLHRYLSSGSLDLTFGDNGSKQIYIGQQAVGYGLKEKTDGSVFVFGQVENSESIKHGFITKLTASGEIDQSFGIDGTFLTDDIANATEVVIKDIGIDGAGKIVAIGSLKEDDSTKPVVMRISPTGVLDSDSDSYDGPGESFQSEGYEIGDAGDVYTALVVESSRNTYIAGTTGAFSTNFRIIKYELNGVQDSSFSGNGENVIVRPLSSEEVNGLLISPEGHLYMFGSSNKIMTKSLVVKFNTDGTKFDSFGNGGLAEVSNVFGSGVNSATLDVSIDSDGRILLVGFGENNSVKKGAIARLLSDGNLDTDFGIEGNGKFLATDCQGEQSFTALIQNTNDQIVVSSQCDNGVSQDISLSQFNFYEEGVEP